MRKQAFRDWYGLAEKKMPEQVLNLLFGTKDNFWQRVKSANPDMNVGDDIYRLAHPAVNELMAGCRFGEGTQIVQSSLNAVFNMAEELAKGDEASIIKRTKLDGCELMDVKKSMQAVRSISPQTVVGDVEKGGATVRHPDLYAWQLPC